MPYAYVEIKAGGKGCLAAKGHTDFVIADVQVAQVVHQTENDVFQVAALFLECIDDLFCEMALLFKEAKLGKQREKSKKKQIIFITCFDVVIIVVLSYFF